MVWKGLGEIGCAAVDCPASTAEDKKVYRSSPETLVGSKYLTLLIVVTTDHLDLDGLRVQAQGEDLLLVTRVITADVRVNRCLLASAWCYR